MTRSWKIHKSSSDVIPPQDFIRINKLAIKMNAANYNAFKDFRKNIDIKQKIKHGYIDRKIYLPKEGFTYGKPNRPPTPIKDIINNNYGNLAEITIRNEYRNFLRKMRSQSNININKRLAQMRKMFEEKRKKILEEKKEKMGLRLGEKPGNNTVKVEKPLYKLKMFMDVGSKVAEGIKLFKSYRPPKKKIRIEKNENKSPIDPGKESKTNNMINKGQEEVKQKEENKNKYEALPII